MESNGDRMRTPIKFRKHLVYEFPKNIQLHDEHSDFIVRKVTLEDLSLDPWLRERKNAFQRMLDEGHLGITIYNENKQCIAYGWIAVQGLHPSHLPQVPGDAVWCHYARVKENYRGQGLHRLLIRERIKLIRKMYGNISVYTDTSPDNIPSRINQAREGFVQCGVYYTLQMGSKRFTPFYFLVGRWFKNKKHPEISLRR